jgi:hypothetical protein
MASISGKTCASAFSGTPLEPYVPQKKAAPAYVRRALCDRGARRVDAQGAGVVVEERHRPALGSQLPEMTDLRDLPSSLLEVLLDVVDGDLRKREARL